MVDGGNRSVFKQNECIGAVVDQIFQQFMLQVHFFLIITGKDFV